MQTLQTRQIFAIIKTKFSRENSIFNVTVRGKTKFDSLFCCYVELLVSTEWKLILNLILGLPQTSYLHLSFLEGVTRYRFKG